MTYATRRNNSSAVTTISVKKNLKTEEQQALPTAFYELDMQDGKFKRFTQIQCLLTYELIS